MCKLPWTRRLEEQRRRRREAEKLLHDAKADWLEIDAYTRAVKHEVALNQWTQTAKRIFGGGS